MFVRWVVSNLTPFGAHPKIGARKISSPYIFVAGVQIYVFTTSRLAVNS